jgi:hypothetical protein
MCFLDAWATAQDVPPPPPLRGDVASLKDTMKFIQDKLPGKVNFIVYSHDNVAGTDLPNIKRGFELSNVSGNPERCHISFHWRIDYGNSANVTLKDDEIFLKQVREVTLIPMDQFVQRNKAKAGHPEISIRVDPPVFLIIVTTEAKPQIGFYFYDEALSDRLSKALQHAVELCGGGNSEPF